MQSYKKAMRIQNLIERLDDRGAELMRKAIRCRDADRRDACIAGIRVAASRCQKLAAYIDGLNRPNPKRRSA